MDFEARGLLKRFSGITVVRDVNFTLRPGEVVGYLNILLSQLPKKPDSHVVLDKDQADRRVGVSH